MSEYVFGPSEDQRFATYCPNIDGLTLTDGLPGIADVHLVQALDENNSPLTRIRAASEAIQLSMQDAGIAPTRREFETIDDSMRVLEKWGATDDETVVPRLAATYNTLAASALWHGQYSWAGDLLQEGRVLFQRSVLTPTREGDLLVNKAMQCVVDQASYNTQDADSNTGPERLLTTIQKGINASPEARVRALCFLSQCFVHTRDYSNLVQCASLAIKLLENRNVTSKVSNRDKLVLFSILDADYHAFINLKRIMPVSTLARMKELGLLRSEISLSEEIGQSPSLQQ